MTIQKIFSILLFLSVSFYDLIFAQIKTLDDFETTEGWSFIKSDGVTLQLSTDAGLNGNALDLIMTLQKAQATAEYKNSFRLIYRKIMNLHLM